MSKPKLEPCAIRTTSVREWFSNRSLTVAARIVAARISVQRGFTLLELLVAVTVVSLLSTAILFSWRVALSAWGKANTRLESDRTVLATVQLLREQMASMVPYLATTPQGAREMFFQGEPETARFVSRYSLAHRAHAGLVQVAYQVIREADGSKQLLLQETPVRDSAGPGMLLVGALESPQGRLLQFRPFERDAQTIVLLRDLEECSFEYYRPGFPAQPGGWREQWAVYANELPRAMRIRAAPRGTPRTLAWVSQVALVRNYSLKRD